MQRGRREKRRRAASVARERLIKRYENRKLYDPEDGRYVTLDDLARMVSAGAEVRVVDQASGEDLTSVVLGQVVLEGLKQRTASIPQQVLTRLIRLGSGAQAAAREWLGPHDPAGRAREEAERIVGGLLSRGRLTLDEALALRQEITGAVQRVASEAQTGLEARLRGLLEHSEQDGAVGPALQALRERLLSFQTLLGEQEPAPPAPAATRPPTTPSPRRRPKPAAPGRKPSRRRDDATERR